MEDLPNSLIRQMALSLSLNEINSLCRTNKKFNQAICQYQIFWYNKLVNDYKVTEAYSEELDRKKIYKYYKYRLIGLGSNGQGRLGLISTRKVDNFTYIPTVAFKDIACGDSYSIFIDINGNLWVTGDNYSGQLGANTARELVRTFTQLHNNTKFIQVACGTNHTLALSEDNEIWVTGSNEKGQLGTDFVNSVDWLVKIKKYRAKQIACNNNYSAFIDLEGNLHIFGQFNNNRYKIPGNLSIIQVSCGYNHIMCIDGNNDIWGFGNADDGRLGIENRPYNIEHPKKISNHKAKYISCGFNYTAFIDLEDRVWIFGNNNHKQLGLLNVKIQYTPRRITQVYYEGQVVNLDFRVRQVHCYHSTTLFIDLEDNLWVTGKSEGLHIDSEIPVIVPRIKVNKVATGTSHMIIGGYYN